jgi:hypothetical protein
LVLGALLVAALSVAAGSASQPKFQAAPLTPDSTYVGAKSTSGSLAQTDPSLLGRTDATPVNVLIKYDYDATASYAGGASGLAATSPAVTGKKLKNNKDAVEAYEQHTRQVSSDISAAVKSAVPGADIRGSFQTVYGGVAAQVPANSVADLLKVDGVTAVQKDSLEQPLTDATPSFMGATDVWPSVGGPENAASNVVVGVIDTGIWPEHPSFADHGLPAPPGGPYGCQFGDGSDVAHLGPTFACQRKLVGAYAKTATYMANVGAGANEFCNNTTHTCSARDPEGHGTHTASTAAGDRVASATLYGVERGPISGIAPGARVIMYRVCLASGCFGSDSVAAVQQAILDDVDVINFSISGGGNPYTDAVELAFLDAFHAGVSVNASGGNSGPAAGTVDHGGPWVTTVGASTSNRFFTSTLRLTADGGATFDMPGVTVTNGISSPTPVVLAQSIPTETTRCQTKLASGSAATGKIVMCQRGTNARVDKGYNVLAGGAAGMILYNAANQDVETDNHWLPAIHVNGPQTDLLAFVNGHTNVMATWVQGTASPTQGDMMAAFSSRGPQADFIKPDVTAPGIQVLAGMTPQPDPDVVTNGPSGNLYQAIAGTSMSSPHSAGASALVKAAHPDWTPAMIKSALMTSSAQGVVKEDGVTPADPFDDGAGSIRINRAVNPTLVFDETYADYIASATDPLHRIDLNLPSVNAPTMTGLITTKRTAINVSGKDQDLEVSVAAPAGAEILVSDKAPGKDGAKGDKKIKLKKHGTTDLWITISAPELANGQYFGRITLDPKKGDTSTVTIPVAFNKRQGIVTLTHSCDPLTFAAKTGLTNCTATVANFGGSPADVGLTVTNIDKKKGLDFTNITAPATAIKKNDGVQWSGTLTPAVPPQVVSITPLGSTDFDYLPLSLFGVAPIAGVGDDTIHNFNVPTFYVGGEAYTRIGVVSNGYVVIGGGSGADVSFAPQTFPAPARPNNVVAPFWTDTNVPAGGAIRIATLADGPAGPTTTTWLVVDYAAVKNFSNATTHTGELWFRLASGAAGTGPSSEQVTISYGAANAAAGDPGSGINWGAENRDGTSGVNLAAAPADDTEYTVNTSPPAAGGSATITYDASSKKAGTYKSVAGMTSTVTPGTTQVVQTLTVTP